MLENELFFNPDEYYFTWEDWNNNETIQNNPQTQSIATEKDLTVRFFGYAFLVRTSDYNVFCCKVAEGGTFLRAIKYFRAFLVFHKIQYIKIVGTHNRYWFLKKAIPESDFVDDLDEKIDHIQYCKVY